jgi:hypothetical protein
VLRSRSREPKLNYPLESEPILQIPAPAPAPAPAPFYLSKKFYRKKIMVAKEFFVNYHNFNLIWVQHASILVKKGFPQNLFGTGVGASRSHNSNLWLRGAGRNNFSVFPRFYCSILFIPFSQVWQELLVRPVA